MTERAFCPDCGRTIETGLDFCPACGTDLAAGDRRFAGSEDPGAEDDPGDGMVYAAYLLGAAGLLAFPIGLAGAGLGWWAHRQGHPGGRKAMGIAIALAVVSFVVNAGLAAYCIGAGQGSELCAPFQDLLPGG